MNTAASGTKAPIYFWIVAAISLLWNSFGAYDYTATHLPIESYMAAFPADARAFFDSFPAWAVGFWACGVWGAFFGSVLLLLRSRWAVIVFVISLIGLAGSTYYQMTVEAPASVDQGTAGVFSLIIWGIAAFLLIFAISMQRKGVLR